MLNDLPKQSKIPRVVFQASTASVYAMYLLEIGLTIRFDIFTTLSSNRTKVPVVMRVMLVESELMMMSSLFWTSSLLVV